jgi:twitching motility protein PilT
VSELHASAVPVRPSSDGRRVLVLGGTSGIGAAVAERFVRDGANVTVAGLDSSAAPEALSDTVDLAELDLRDDAAVETLANPPRIRVRGALKSLQTEICTPELMFQIARDVLDDRQYDIFRKHGQFDFAYDYDEDNRFRVNIFMARGKPSLAARLITSDVKTFESLHLPQILGDVAMSASGLILFSGVTGSGKSTSIASMLQYINERKRVHIVTIEDPIE